MPRVAAVLIAHALVACGVLLLVACGGAPPPVREAPPPTRGEPPPPEPAASGETPWDVQCALRLQAAHEELAQQSQAFVHGDVAVQATPRGVRLELPVDDLEHRRYFPGQLATFLVEVHERASPSPGRRGDVVGTAEDDQSSMDLEAWNSVRTSELKVDIVTGSVADVFRRAFEPAVRDCLTFGDAPRVEEPPPPPPPRVCEEEMPAQSSDAPPLPAPPAPPRVRRPRLAIVPQDGATPDQSAFYAALPAALREVERCYGDALRDDAALSGGAAVTLRVAPDGKLELVGDRAEATDDRLRVCVRAAVPSAHVATRFAGLQTSAMIALCPADRAVCIAGVVPVRPTEPLAGTSPRTTEYFAKLRERGDAIESSVRAVLRAQRGAAGSVRVAVDVDALGHTTGMAVHGDAGRSDDANAALLDALHALAGVCLPDGAPTITVGLVVHAP